MSLVMWTTKYMISVDNLEESNIIYKTMKFKLILFIIMSDTGSHEV